jgi:hypothetical protein
MDWTIDALKRYDERRTTRGLTILEEGGGIMDRNGMSWRERIRGVMGFVVVASSAGFIVALAAFVIHTNPLDGKDVLNTVLPVFASWVGMVLAFYFGQRSFQTATEQAQKLSRISPEERAKARIASIMRHFSSTAHFAIPAGRSEKDVTLAALRDKLKKAENASRLPIVDAGRRPKYMIHESSLDKYEKAGGSEADTLETFIARQKAEGRQFGLGGAFVVVAEDATIAEAKRKMEQKPFCQDIFVTARGTADEPLIGWVSNVRLAESLEA